MDIIQQIISDFHDCTGIGVRFFDESGSQINTIGHVDNNFHPFTQTEMAKFKNATKILTATNVHHIVFPFNEKRQITGCFIIGPYQSGCTNNKKIIFKPSHCTPYFEELLHLIIKRKLTQNLEQNPHIAKSIQYINENHHLPITLQEVSNHTNLNMCYFCSLFKTTTGLTFNQYLIKTRIERSKELLINSSNSIIDISLSVGFNNHNYFSSTFKKMTGVTPTTFRNSSRV